MGTLLNVMSSIFTIKSCSFWLCINVLNLVIIAEGSHLHFLHPWASYHTIIRTHFVRRTNFSTEKVAEGGDQGAGPGGVRRDSPDSDWQDGAVESVRVVGVV